MLCENEAILAGKRIKLMLFDLDGTFLNSESQVLDSTVDALAQARERGIYSSICSGRSLPMLAAICKRAGIEGAVVTLNGAQIVDTRDGKILEQTLLERDKLLPLLRFCRDNGLSCDVMSDEFICFSSRGRRYGIFDALNRNELIPGGLPPINLCVADEDFKTLEGRRLGKVVVDLNSQDERAAIVSFVENETDFAWTTSSPRLVEILDPRVNKGAGALALMRGLGLSRDEVCVFGDYDNDLPMFATFPLSIAMGNAPDRVKNAAAYVTGDNNSNGIADAVRNIILT